MRFRLLTIIGLLTVLLSGCGVRIELAPTLAPTQPPTFTPTTSPTVAPMTTPTPPLTQTPTETPRPPLNINPGLTRLIAMPRLAFISNQAALADPFLADAVPDAYLIIGKGLRLTASYDVTWYADAQGSARVRLSSYTRAAPDQPWTPGDYTEEPLIAAPPATKHNALSAMVPGIDPGKLLIRAEVEIVAQPLSADPVSHIDTLEFTSFVFSDPGPIPPNLDALKPKLGRLDPAQLLFDWRGWAGGPCALIDPAKADPYQIALRAACRAVKAKNVTATLAALQTALGLAAEPESVARLHAMLGLAQAVAGAWEPAAANLEAAANMWQTMDRAADFAISAFNLANVEALNGNQTKALSRYAQLFELHDQIDDEAGKRLLQADYAHLAGDRSALDEAQRYFTAQGLPQAAIAQTWLNAIPTPAPS